MLMSILLLWFLFFVDIYIGIRWSKYKFIRVLMRLPLLLLLLLLLMLSTNVNNRESFSKISNKYSDVNSSEQISRNFSKEILDHVKNTKLMLQIMLTNVFKCMTLDRFSQIWLTVNEWQVLTNCNNCSLIN